MASSPVQYMRWKSIVEVPFWPHKALVSSIPDFLAVYVYNKARVAMIEDEKLGDANMRAG